MISTKLNRVIVIDDDPIHNFIAEKIINKLEGTNKLRFINNPSEAMKYIENGCSGNRKKFYFDLVLLDKNMSVDGLELLREMKIKGIENIDKKMIIIMLTTLELMEKEKLEAHSLGVKEFLLKPLLEYKLNEIIIKYF